MFLSQDEIVLSRVSLPFGLGDLEVRGFKPIFVLLEVMFGSLGSFPMLVYFCSSALNEFLY